MRLSARVLDAVGGVNIFTVVSRVSMTEGDSGTLYLQLLDQSLDLRADPPGRRYVPAAGASLQVIFQNINDAKKVTKVATQPFPGDASLWAVTLTGAEGLRGTVSALLQLTEGSKVTKGRVDAALGIESLNPVM